MKLRKYWYIGIMAGIVLSLTGCGEKEKEVTEPEKTVAQETEEKADAEKKEKKADKDNENIDEELSIADVAGDKAAKLFEETSEEELLAMIPETEIPVMGYYQRYATGKTRDVEITGYMKEVELVNRDNECITVSGIVESESLKTEQPVQGIYFISVNEDETALQLISATVTDAPETVHIVPTVPFPTAEQLLDMGLAVKIVAFGNNYYSEPVPLKDYVTEIWYDEETLEEELSDWDYNGRIYYVLNGVEQRAGVSIEYLPYKDEDAVAAWTFYEDDNVCDTIDREEAGIPDEELSWPEDFYKSKEHHEKMDKMWQDLEKEAEKNRTEQNTSE